MFQFIRDLYRRHRKKFLLGTGVVAVSYLISIYVRNKISEFQQQLKEENATRDLIKKRFAQTQKDCYMTFLSFLPVLAEPIFKELDVDQITTELKLIKRDKVNNNSSEGNKSELNTEDITSTIQLSKSSNVLVGSLNKKTKSELWQDLKIKSLTRLLTLVYSESLLIILLHLQLNIISRKSYLKTALKLATKNQGIRLIDIENLRDDNDNDNRFGFSKEREAEEEELSEQAFLSFTWWLLNEGWMKLKNIINDSVEEKFSNVGLREELSIEDLGKLLFEVQKSIDVKLFENSDELVSIMMPPKEQDFEILLKTSTQEFLTKFNSNVSNMGNLHKMNNELKGYLKNDKISTITKKLATIGISSVLDCIQQTLFLRQESKAGRSAIPPNHWKLALILTVLGTPANELTSQRFDNPVLYQMNNLPELDDLSASVYSNFDI